MNSDFVTIDGSQGEGGGQVLRSALSLSVITGQPVHIKNIRANRTQPGLKAQHLKAVDAAAAVSKAEVTGATLGSSEITFRPLELRSGRYKFDIGTAGAASLVLQTIFLPLSLAGSASSVIITGGTHVPWSPCFHYLDQHWLPYLTLSGFNANLELNQAGFYPRGGGRIDAVIRPAREITPLQLTKRGALLRIRGISVVANLSNDILERQKRHALRRLQNLPAWKGSPDLRIQSLRLPAPGKGTMLLLLAEFEGGRCCYYGLGAIGKPAESVADEAVDALLIFQATGATVDQYLADQLLLPLSLARGVSEFRTSRITLHLFTNAVVLGIFLPVKVEIEGELDQPGIVRITPK